MEQVFVVERSAFFGGQWPQGLTRLSAQAAATLLADFELRGFYANRDRAENEPAWKQLIPYCVLRRGPEVFCVERTQRQGEQRLHGLLSIGLGGHVNPIDSLEPSDSGRLRVALRRELDEELSIRWSAALGPPRLLGLLNDDSNPVGQVHAGLVFVLDFDPTSRIDLTNANTEACDVVQIRETSAMRGGFTHLADAPGLWQDRGRFESWSRLLLEVGIAGPMAVSSRDRNNRCRQESGREEQDNG